MTNEAYRLTTGRLVLPRLRRPSAQGAATTVWSKAGDVWIAPVEERTCVIGASCIARYFSHPTRGCRRLLAGGPPAVLVAIASTGTTRPSDLIPSRRNRGS